MQEEFASPDFNPGRLEKRFAKTAETLAGRPDKPIWSSGGKRAEAKATWRMPGNGKADREGVPRARREAAAGRLAQPETAVPAVRDTAGLNGGAQTKTEGMGHAGNGKAPGANAHGRPAAAADGLAPGAPAQPPHKRGRPRGGSRTHGGGKARPPEEKESFRRLQTLGAGAVGVPEEARIAAAHGREGDMRGLFGEAAGSGRPFPGRMAQNRKTAENAKALDETRKKPCAGKAKAALPRNPRRSLKEGEAALEMRRRRFGAKRPPIPGRAKRPQAARKASAVHAREERPGQKPEDKAVGPMNGF
jgi:hypothetical protein